MGADRSGIKMGIQAYAKNIRVILWNLLLMAVGSIICSASVNGILIPKQFFAAGFTGLALLLHYFFPIISVSIIYALLNVPVFALGWMYVGRRFFAYSIIGLIVYSTALHTVQVQIQVHDKILSALLAGIMTGIGSGLILRSLGSAGGLDILSVILLKRFSISLGTSILGFNCMVLFFGGLFFSLERALYTLVFMYVSSKTVNLVVTGLSQRKSVIIISDKWERISREIMDRLHRGVTILHGKGAFTGKSEEILYIVITLAEISKLKRLVRDIDPDVFMVISDTAEVMGKRIGNQPHW